MPPFRTPPSRFARHSPQTPRAAEGWRLSTLMAPAALYGSNGIRIGPDGRLWICEGVGNRVSALDPATGALETAVAMNDPIVSPDDLAFDSAGHLYLTEFTAGRVARRSADGGYRVLSDAAPAANGIAVVNDRVYVTEFRAGGRLLELDRDRPGPPRVLAELDWPNGFDVGADGRVYVQNLIAGTILVLDPAAGTRRTLVEGLNLPSAVKLGPDGTVVVSEGFDGRISAFDPDSGARTVLMEETGVIIDNFCFDGAGNLYLSSFADGRIMRRSRDGGGGRLEMLIEGGLIGPYGVGRFGDGLIVADHIGLVVREPDGSTWRWRTPLERGPTQAVAALDDNTAFVMSAAGAVYRAEKDGPMRDVIAAGGPTGFEGAGLEAAGGGSGARALTADDGCIHVLMADGEVRRLEVTGRTLDSWPSGVKTPAALAVEGEMIAVADGRNSVTLRRGGEVTTIRGLEAPKGLALIGGALFVAEEGARRVTRIDRNGRAILANDLPFGSPVPGAVLQGRTPVLLRAADDSLVIGCDGDGSVRRLAEN